MHTQIDPIRDRKLSEPVIADYVIAIIITGSIVQKLLVCDFDSEDMVVAVVADGSGMMVIQVISVTINDYDYLDCEVLNFLQITKHHHFAGSESGEVIRGADEGYYSKVVQNVTFHDVYDNFRATVVTMVTFMDDD